MGKLSKELKMSIHNKFDIEVVDVKTGEVKQKAQAFNVICNSYFSNNAMKSILTEIAYGDGTGTPSASDTQLFHELGEASEDSLYGCYETYDASREKDGIWSRQIKRVITNNMSVGKTITEVGLKATSNDTLATHAMLQDMNGNQISIQHTSTDIINVYATTYLHYSGQNSDIHLYAALIKGDSYWAESGFVPYILGGKSITGDGSRRPGYNRNSAGGYWYWLYSNIGVLTGYVASCATAWDATNRRLTATFSQIPIGSGNIDGGSNFIRLGGQGSERANVIIETGKTTIPPFNITDESVGVGDGSTVKFKTKYSMPYNAVVKVNGVVQASGVSVQKKPSVDIANSLAVSIDAKGFQFFRPVYKEKVTLPSPGTIINDWTSTGINSYSDMINVSRPCIEVLTPDIGVYLLRGSISGDRDRFFGSNDGVTWNAVTFSSSDTYGGQVDPTDAHYKYYYYSGESRSVAMNSNAYDGYNIIFDTPPANGAVITVDYTTDYIPKDSDHVLDMTLTLTLGEYQGE